MFRSVLAGSLWEDVALGRLACRQHFAGGPVGERAVQFRLGDEQRQCPRYESRAGVTFCRGPLVAWFPWASAR